MKNIRGSINDVSQLQLMLDKAYGYGYKKIGFILDRGHFSRSNIKAMDRLGYSFVIMVKEYTTWLMQLFWIAKEALKING